MNLNPCAPFSFSQSPYRPPPPSSLPSRMKCLICTKRLNRWYSSGASQPSPGTRKQQIISPQHVRPLSKGLSWRKAPWKHLRRGLPRSWGGRAQMGFLGGFLSLLISWPFHSFMTNRSLQKCLVFCHPLKCLKAPFTHLHSHAKVYWLTSHNYWGLGRWGGAWGLFCFWAPSPSPIPCWHRPAGDSQPLSL